MAKTHPVILPGGNATTRSGHVSSKSKKRFCVIVLGMHRSGTSALARTLNMLGCDLPKNVLPANKNNEKGYWESGPVVALNNELLSSAGSTWQDLRAVDPSWFTSPKSDEFRQKANNLLEEEFGGSHLFVLKDPRICRLVPFWLDVLESSNISPYIILPIRHPLEVMASSSQMKGLEPAYVSLIWLHHVLEAEYFSRGKPRCFTSYDRLLADWKTVAVEASKSFGFSWPSLTAKSAEISTFLSQNNRHHSEDKQTFIGDSSVAVWIRETYRIMDGWAESGEKSEDFSTLDRIRAEFNASTPAFMAMYAAGDKATKRERRLKTQLEETTEILEQQRKDLELKASQFESVEKALEESRLALQTHETALSDFHTQLQEKEDALSRTQLEVENFRGQYREAQQSNAALEARLRQNEEVLVRTQLEAEEHRERGNESRRMFEEARNNLVEQGLELTWVKKELEAQRAELIQARQENENSRIREGDVQRHAADMEARLRKSEEALTLSHREVQQYRERDTESRFRLEEARISLTEQGVEIAWLKKELELRQSELTQARQENEISRIREGEAQRNAADLGIRLRQLEEALTQSYQEKELLLERDHEARRKNEEARHSLTEQSVEIAWLKSELELQRTELAQARQETGNCRIRESEAHRNAAHLEARLRQNEEALLRVHREMEEYRERASETRSQLEEARSSLAQQAMEFAWLKKEHGTETEELGIQLSNIESELSQYRREAEKMVELIVSLEQEKRVAEQTMTTLKARLDEIMTEEASARSKLKANVAKLQEQKEQLDAELSRIRLDLVKVRKQLTREKTLREWMHKTTPLLVNVGSSWKSKLLDLAPARLSRARQMKQLKREGLFDAAAYLSANPDVAASGIDPLYHYLRHGMLENRELSFAAQATPNPKGQKK